MRPGDICLRDGRVLHGGTPNTGNSTRYLPSVEFASKALRDTGRQDIWPPARVISEAAFDGLPEKAQGAAGSFPRILMGLPWGTQGVCRKRSVVPWGFPGVNRQWTPRGL